ncbi:hypothetical protein C2S52_003287 [Perilla frutescens var. hirtella]|nr:hypothetical protein C2S52_003287 [Perilla frutescens var. hirtella]
MITSQLSKIRCPCRKCGNLYKYDLDNVRAHIFTSGFDKLYKVWTFHGEERTTFDNMDPMEEAENVSSSEENDTFFDMLNDLRDAEVIGSSAVGQEGDDNIATEGLGENYMQMFEEAQKEFKICYACHRRFLPNKHPWRKNRSFNGKFEIEGPPRTFTGYEISAHLDLLPEVILGKHVTGAEKRDMETRFTRPDRNKDVSQPSSCKLSIFSGQVRVFGGQRNHKLSYALRKKAHWYILNNCKEVEVYKKEHLQILSTKLAPDLIFQYHELEFPQWFKEKMPKKKSMVQEFSRTCIDISKTWYDDDPFILATQAQQVYYLDDIKRGGYWKVVEKVQHRGIYEVMEKEDENDELSLSDVSSHNEPIQELSSNEISLVVHDGLDVTNLCRIDIGPQHVDLPTTQGVVNKKIELLLLYNKADKVAADTKDFIQTMPPKRVQDLHDVDSVSGNHSTSDVASDSSSGIRSKRRDTRATHSDMLRSLIERQGKIPVTFQKVDGRPSGQYAAGFMTELGIAVKKFAPLQVSKWKEITDEQKMPIFDRLESSFIVDFGKGPNSIRKETDKLMNARYRDNRCKMHDHYLALAHLPWERRLVNVPFDYCDTVKDWEFMCRLFESDAFKDGTKRKDRITVYGDTHFSLKNGWIGGTEAVYERMVQLREEYKEKQLETGSKPLTDLEISSLVCDEVLGVRPGYIRGMGHGPKPATWMFYDASSNQPTNEELKNELQATQDALKCVRAEQEMMREAFEKIFPGVLQSMFRESSPRTQSHYPPTAI